MEAELREPASKQSLEPPSGITTLKSTSWNSQQPTLVEKTKEISKAYVLRFPSLGAPPEVVKDEKGILERALPTSMFRMEPQMKPLKIQKINRHRSTNGVAHHTFYYDLMNGKGQGLVLRRGSPARFSFSLNRPYGNTDVLFLEFILNDVESPQFANGSFVRVKVENGSLTAQSNEYTWLAVCDFISDNGITIHVQVRPADKTPLGHWGMRILSTSETYALMTPFKNLIYIVANPWGKDFSGAPDPGDIKKKDNVLADVGLVFTGFVDNPVAVPWRFGQFDKNILEMSISLLNGLQPQYRSHLFKVVHHLSYLLNDRLGVVVEKKVPAKQWSGSPNILLKYIKSNKKPLDGSRQIYVGACVFVTVCRALGIPARTVSFYNVLPENDGGLAVDRYHHTLGFLLHNVNLSNMWSYKVLPEVIAHRPDLPPPFISNSWQCVSHFGPCSVGAIRAGALYRTKPYCTDYIYRMIKANYINLKAEDPNKPLKVVPPRTMTTCTLIATKAVASWNPENIVASYTEAKSAYRAVQLRDFPEAVDAFRFEVTIPPNYNGGTKRSHSARCRVEQRRNSEILGDKVAKAVTTGVPLIDTLKENNCSISGFYYDEDLDIVMELIASSSWWGEPIKAALVVRSKLKTDTTAFFSIEISTVSATGELLTTVKTAQTRIVLKQNIDEMMTIQVLFYEYSGTIKPGDALRVNANVHVEEEDFDQYFEKYIGFIPLNVAIKIIDPASNTCEVFLNNPSSELLKKCSLSVGELDSANRTTLFSGLKLSPGSRVQATIGFMPKISTGLYFIEARATCGDRSSSAYAALAFTQRSTLIPNIPSTTFGAI